MTHAWIMLFNKKTEKIICVIFLLAVGFIATGFSLSPKTWIKDISKFWSRSKPSVENVTFWDFEKEQMRGLRSFFYTIPKERVNRMVELRLHNKMAQFLSYICRDVITLDDIEDIALKKIAEEKMTKLIDEWKLTGQITPDTLFSSPYGKEDPRPFIDIDILVLIERIHYDQVWRGDNKQLVIGISAAAFEMDFGTPVYQDRIMVESPWFGETGNYNKAEHAALMQVADAMGQKLQTLASKINAKHAELEQQKIAAQKEQQALFIAQVKQEALTIEQLVTTAEELVEKGEGPDAILLSLQTSANEIKPLLKKKTKKESLFPSTKKRTLKTKPKVSKKNLSPEDIENRRLLAQALQDNLKALDDWKTAEAEKIKQAAIAAQPSLKQDGANMQAKPQDPRSLVQNAIPKDQLIGLPKIDYPKGNLFDRGWLLPSQRALKPGSVPIINSGAINLPDIESTTIPQNIPESFQKFQTGKLPPLPAASSIPSSTQAK
jgi:hypothetical protein